MRLYITRKEQRAVAAMPLLLQQAHLNRGHRQDLDYSLSQNEERSRRED